MAVVKGCRVYLFMKGQLVSLSKKKDFEETFKKGRSSFDSIIGIKCLKNNIETSRFGLVVSTKVSKKAVERNLIKRRLRAAVRECLFGLYSGYDCIIIALPLINKKKYSEILDSLDKHFKKLKLYKKV